MILVGIDDTDMPDTPGTNQLARALALRVGSRHRCLRIVRHQLLADPRVPCTSKNGSASLWLQPIGDADLAWLVNELRVGMQEAFQPGSDPGLCVAEAVPQEVITWGRRCQRELVSQREARDLAAGLDIHLEGLGGTEGGVIGALAAVGLAATGDDGRVVHLEGWPDDLAGIQPSEAVAARGVEVRELASGRRIEGLVDLGKKLRPNCREGRMVLFVERGADELWRAVRLL
jgi:tRNA(Ile2) C34 agmatinyltransferase TiaS